MNVFEELAKAFRIEGLHENDIVVAAKCKCGEEFEIFLDKNDLQHYEEDIVEHGYSPTDCEDCYHQSMADAYFGAKEDDGRYSIYDVYSEKELL